MIYKRKKEKSYEKIVLLVVVFVLTISNMTFATQIKIFEEKDKTVLEQKVNDFLKKVGISYIRNVDYTCVVDILSEKTYSCCVLYD